MARPKVIDDTKLIGLFKQGQTLKAIGKELGVSHVAIHKRIKRLGLRQMPKSLECLTDKERAFCIAVAGGQSRTAACMTAYDVSSRESAKALQRTLKKNELLQVAIADLYELSGIGRIARTQKLAQHVHSQDPVISLKALDIAMKTADDAGERKGNDQETLTFTKFDLNLLRGPGDFKKSQGRCAICAAETVEDFCVSCNEKYPELIKRTVRYWNGDECAACEDDRRCFDFCKSCKEGKQNV